MYKIAVYKNILKLDINRKNKVIVVIEKHKLVNFDKKFKSRNLW